MKKIFHLESCKTCQKILAELQPLDNVEIREIKSKGVTPAELEEMRKLTDSYESLFSKRAQLYKEMDLKNANLSEADYKHYILDHYTFLSRPVIIINNQIFIGNSKKIVEAAHRFIQTQKK